MEVELNDYSTTNLIIRPQTDFERMWLDNMFGDRTEIGKERNLFTAKIIDHGLIKETKGLLIKIKEK